MLDELMGRIGGRSPGGALAAGPGICAGAAGRPAAQELL